MNKQELQDQILNILSKHNTGVLASVEQSKPHLRYMTFFHDGLTLFTPTQKDTEKIEEIERNPYVSVLLGFENKGQDDTYVEVLGTSSINESEELKQKYWDESFKQWFSGPDDQNFVLLEIKPITFRLLNKKGSPPQELTV